LSLAEQHQGWLLELGCGTGRVSLPLAEEGNVLTGIDKDPAMLAVLRARIPDRLLPSIHLIQADFTAFHLERRFPLIILPCNTYTTLQPESRSVLLQRVREHLLPGGVFALSMPNPVLLKRLPRRSEPEVEESFLHPLDGEPVQVSSAWERRGSALTFIWHYDHLLPNGNVERLSAQAEHALLSREIVTGELESAGLSPQAVYGDYDRSPYSASSSFLVIVAGLK
jgi:SAM-dependent methyltransferase